IPERLRTLAERGVRILLGFSQADEGLAYFRAQYGKSFEKLRNVPGVAVEVLSTDAHVLSLDDWATEALTEIISRWAPASSCATPKPAPSPEARRASRISAVPDSPRESAV